MTIKNKWWIKNTYGIFEFFPMNPKACGKWAKVLGDEKTY
jgi:hypothetical protein